MINLRGLAAQFFRIPRNHPWFSLGALVVMFAGTGLWFNWHQVQLRHERQQAALATLKEQQKTASPTTAPVKPQASDNADTAFKDISDSAFTKPDCNRLQNRKAVVIFNSGCDYRLRAFGKVKIAVVFLFPPYGTKNALNNLKDQNEANTQSLYNINRYLREQGKRYGVADPLQLDFEFFGPYAIPYIAQFRYNTDYSTLSEIFNGAAKQNKVPENDYDAVEYVILNGDWGGVAWPYEHRAFSYDGYGGAYAVPIFTHETLHLFGASDKYNNSDCATIGSNDPFGRYNGTLPGQDIMCSNYDLSSSKINDITAREIGWKN